MKRILIVILLFIMISCNAVSDRTEIRFVCDCEARKKCAEFISKNMEAANNKSDEEMEDVILQLEQTAVRMYCKQKPVLIRPQSWRASHANKLDSCEVIMSHIE